MDSTPLRMGVLGCANIAERRVIPAMLRCDDVALQAVASREAAKAEHLANAFDCDAVEGYDALLARDDLDAVYVPLPTGLHEEWVGRALEAGLHVLVEKSFTDRHEVARRLTDRARERGLVLMENLMFVHHGQQRRLRELLAEGAVGELKTVRSAFGYPPLPDDDFRWRPELGGGALIDAGTYPIRAARLVLEDPEHLGEGGELKLLGASLRVDPERGVDVQGAALLERGPGVTAQCTFGMDYFYQCTLELWGTAGRIVLERVFTAHPDVRPPLVLDRGSGTERIELPEDDHFANLLSEFARAVREDDGAWHRADLVEQARLLEAVRKAGTRP